MASLKVTPIGKIEQSNVRMADTGVQNLDADFVRFWWVNFDILDFQLFACSLMYADWPRDMHADTVQKSARLISSARIPGARSRHRPRRQQLCSG